jgi:hypothetical protein
MARIARSDHPKILQAVDVKGRKVGEVAAEYGCTPANIYAILTRLRREGVAPQEQSAPAKILAAPESPKQTAKPAKAKTAPKPAANATAEDLFAGTPAPSSKSTGSAKQPATPVQSKSPAKSPAPVSAPATPAPLSKTAGNRAGGVGAKTAKPGFGLLIRTADGEDALTPFRSLEDLLSAVKPILRTAARSPETIWFTIQPVDLATIEIDAE